MVLLLGCWWCCGLGIDDVVFDWLILILRMETYWSEFLEVRRKDEIL